MNVRLTRAKTEEPASTTMEDISAFAAEASLDTTVKEVSTSRVTSSNNYHIYGMDNNNNNNVQEEPLRLCNCYSVFCCVMRVDRSVLYGSSDVHYVENYSLVTHFL